ncbi:DUF3099 domain-containing protein [Actinacidiphila soli]|jgi:hypothetical protein|uniref:DUF3099 domain-containing protein n=1 Tax=Actinacidiphila soli TaxID=2487275 RepID=UPI000FC9C549|nr:DUF3099 domain-containing protein [Actinacidiphila soli]MDX6314173.1 hypothetical protein [Streptomyces sp.]
MRKHSHGEVFRITGARAGLTDDVRGRQRRYIISMSVRTVSFILFVALWNVSRPLGWIALALGLLLPYVAVVVANAGRENAPKLPSTFIHAPVSPMLGPGEEEAENLPAEPVAEEKAAPHTGQS